MGGRGLGGFAEGVGRAVFGDACGPDLGLALGHVSLWCQPRIAVAPARDVDEVLRARQDGAAAHTLAWLRRRQLLLQPRRQLAQHPGRNPVTLAGIDESEEHQVRHQYAPVVAEARDQPRPVDALRRGPQDVRDVRTIEALALHDEGLGPDHLFRRDQPHRTAEDFFLHAVDEPFVIHGGDAVAGAEDDVDEILPAPRLAEPVWERQLRLAARRAQRLEYALEVARMDEDVEVLRVPGDAGVALERVCAADEEVDTRLVEQAHRAQVELSGGRRQCVVHGMVAPIPAPACTGTGAEGAPPFVVRSTWTSTTRKPGSLGKRRRSSGSATL